MDLHWPRKRVEQPIARKLPKSSMVAEGVATVSMKRVEQLSVRTPNTDASKAHEPLSVTASQSKDMVNFVRNNLHNRTNVLHIPPSHPDLSLCVDDQIETVAVALQSFRVSSVSPLSSC